MVKIFVYELHNDCSSAFTHKMRTKQYWKCFPYKICSHVHYWKRKVHLLITGNSFLVRLLYPKMMDFYFKNVSFFCLLNGIYSKQLIKQNIYNEYKLVGLTLDHIECFFWIQWVDDVRYILNRSFMSLYLKYMIMVIQFLDKNATNKNRYIIREFSHWSFEHFGQIQLAPSHHRCETWMF